MIGASKLRKPLRVALLVAISLRGFDLCADSSDGEYVDTFFLRGAALSDPAYLQTLDLRSEDERAIDREHPGVFAHRISRGEDFILAYRLFAEGPPAAPGQYRSTDGEGFEKLTISMPANMPEAGGTVDLGSRQDVVIVYTVGGSAWPHSACSGLVSAGTLELAQVGPKWSVKLHGILRPTGNRSVSKSCGESAIDKEFSASEYSFNQLSPWLGRPGSHVYDETYRPHEAK